MTSFKMTDEISRNPPTLRWVITAGARTTKMLCYMTYDSGLFIAANGWHFLFGLCVTTKTRLPWKVESNSLVPVNYAIIVQVMASHWTPSRLIYSKLEQHSVRFKWRWSWTPLLELTSLYRFRSWLGTSITRTDIIDTPLVIWTQLFRVTAKFVPSVCWWLIRF